MGDWNAKVGSEQTDNITGSFGLGERNKRGDDLIEFCSQNNLRIMNTYFQMHPRRLYRWESPDQNTRNQIDFIMCSTRWNSSVTRVTTLTGADCGSDHNLLIAEVRVRLKRKRNGGRTIAFDLDNLGEECT